MSSLSNNVPTNLTLYSYFRSSSSWRVRVCLALKSLDYETVPIHLVKGEQVASSYRDNVNSLAQVPALAYTLNGSRHTVTQSLAIISFLELAFPDNGDGSTSLFRLNDISAHVFSLSVAEVVNSGIQPLQNLATCSALTSLSGGALQGRAYGKQMIERGLSSLEEMVRKRWLDVGHVSSPTSPPPPGSRCYVLGVSSAAGPGPTVGDACLIPQLYNARRFDVDCSPYPTLLLIEKTCLGERAFVEASPERQPDFEAPPAPAPAPAATKAVEGADKSGGEPDAKKAKN